MVVHEIAFYVTLKPNRIKDLKIRCDYKEEFEYIFLKEANLKPCIGCYNCMAKGEDKCPLRDDRAAIEQKLLAADGGQ